jgi:hypothetical protein
MTAKYGIYKSLSSLQSSKDCGNLSFTNCIDCFVGTLSPTLAAFWQCAMTAKYGAQLPTPTIKTFEGKLLQESMFFVVIKNLIGDYVFQKYFFIA